MPLAFTIQRSRRFPATSAGDLQSIAPYLWTRRLGLMHCSCGIVLPICTPLFPGEIVGSETRLADAACLIKKSGSQQAGSHI
jgi:hypothetical protein